MHALKTGLNADKFATFWMFPKRFYHSSFRKWPLYTLEAAERKHTYAILKHVKTYESGWNAMLSSSSNF